MTHPETVRAGSADRGVSGRIGGSGAALAIIAGLVLGTPAQAAAPADPALYLRAARFSPLRASASVLNGSVNPHWREGGRDRFTYRRELGDGRSEFVVVDAETGARGPAFDAKIVAAGLAAAMARTIEPEHLPFLDYEQAGPDAIAFDVDAKHWVCSTALPSCQGTEMATDSLAVASPDGKWLAFIKDDNLWVRSADGHTAFALTTDGSAHNTYGGTPQSNPLYTASALRGVPNRAAVLWSPDSTRLFTQRLDERQVTAVTLVEAAPADGSTRPRALTWRYPMATDPVLPMAEPWVFDIARRSGRKVDMDPIPTVTMTSVEAKEAWWSPDGRRIFVFVRARYDKTMSLYEVDAATGHARRMVSETGRTFVEAAAIGQRPMVYTLRNGEVIWFSERDGRGHLYVYDGASGRLKRRLTKGNWSVRNVLRVDESAGLVFVAGTERERGDDPYYRKVYRVRLSDGRTTLLTPENADHEVASAQASAYFNPPGPSPEAQRGFSPSGRYFVDVYSRPDLPPVSILRSATGRRIAEIDHADITRLAAGGLVMPERFSALAADGKTRLYGIILRPSNYDPHKRYPVIDSLYPGPQARRAYPRFLYNLFDFLGGQSLAEMGYVVVLVDGRGTPGRTKPFLDETYGRLGLAGHIDDHVAVLRQLAQRYSSLDLDRVGLIGGSAGGYAGIRAMAAYPDVYKVGVIVAPSTDPKILSASFGEVFMGPDNGTNYREAANLPLVPSLKGKIMLIQGGMDWTVTPYPALQIVDALIKNDKDFEFVLIPNADHSPLSVPDGFLLRRSADFFMRAFADLSPARP